MDRIKKYLRKHGWALILFFLIWGAVYYLFSHHERDRNRMIQADSQQETEYNLKRDAPIIALREKLVQEKSPKFGSFDSLSALVDALRSMELVARIASDDLPSKRRQRDLSLQLFKERVPVDVYGQYGLTTHMVNGFAKYDPEKGDPLPVLPYPWNADAPNPYK